jgi:hypothetical protein
MKKTCLLLSFIPLLIVAASCRNKVRLTVAPTVPAATGEVKVGKDQNDNTTVDLSVKHLAPPERLNPPKRVYVVWIQPAGQAAESRGQLMVNNKLEGGLKMVTPHRNFDLFVSAENEVNAPAPSDQVVMRTAISR